MPNYTWNTIIADKDVIASLLKDGKFSFNNIIERPIELTRTVAGSTSECLLGLYLINHFTMENFFTYAHQMHIYYDTNLKLKKDIRKFFVDRLHGREYDEIKEDGIVVAKVTGEDYFNLYKKYGCYNWYDWSNRYWGTKWNACDVDVDENFINFTTAWCEPEPIWRKICQMFPDREIKFEAEYEDNLFVESSNHSGEWRIDAEYERNYPDDMNWDDYDEDDIDWINTKTGEVKA